ncbi:MAG: winged helix-turn-helix domain-containing protein [Acidobacteriaceae bacterium]
MASLVENSHRVGFGLYEVDLQTGELWKAGFRVKLQSQPFKVLVALLEKPGEMVTREDLQTLLWGKDTTVDFDHSIGTAINKIREALGDSADNPRFVETLARRGYRFIAPVTILPRPEAAASRKPTAALEAPPSSPSTHLAADGAGAIGATESSLARANPVSDDPALDIQARTTSSADLPPTIAGNPRRADLPGTGQRTWTIVAVGLVAGAGLTFALGLALGLGPVRGRNDAGPLRIRQITHTGRLLPEIPAMEALPSFATDGIRVFASELDHGGAELAAIYLTSGETEKVEVPSEIAGPAVSDISADGSRLLLRSHLNPASEQPIWVVPTTGGSGLRVANVLAHDAVWMPDGASILYARENSLSVVRLSDGASTELARLPGRAYWMRWSPDGTVLRFTIFDPLKHTLSLWELPQGGHAPRPLLSDWSGSRGSCCGAWAADGSQFVFQVEDHGTSDLWRLPGAGSGTPVRLTNGPLSYGSPLPARTGHRIYMLGLDQHSEVQRLGLDGKQFEPERDFLSDAYRAEYSRDRQWVAWTDAKGRLWRARAADGSEKLQVTPDSLQVFQAHWSPNGQQLALMAREEDKPWQLYVIGAEGGTPENLLPQQRNLADPSWSPDGKSLVFGQAPDLMGKLNGTHTIEAIDLGTRHTTILPGSQALFSPRWSPDGQWIAALSSDQTKLMLYSVATKTWKELADTSAADPVWSSDSKAVYAHAFMLDSQPIERVGVPGGEVTQVTTLASFRSGETADYFFVGLTPANAPLVRARLTTANLYSIDLDRK